MKPINQANTARARERRPAARGKTALRIFALLFGLLVAAPAFALNAIWNTAADVPVTASGYTASGTVTFTLNFAPSAGTNLTVVSNTAAGFITGTFSNLTRGQAVTLTYGGINYRFVANYNGGTGNDLVLQWANARSVAWGYNAYGQLGDNTTTNRLIPFNVLTTGALAGKTVIAQAAGALHSVALCSDGTVAAWGYNLEGELGNSSTTSSSVPVVVNTAGVLAGKTVVAIAVGYKHNLALCSDGTVAAWGRGDQGQLGNTTTVNSTVPVAVNTTGALAGKTVVAVAAGYKHSLARCSDGTVAAWGYNFYGQLGNNSTTNSSVPVAVNTASGVSALFGKTVIAVAAGGYHNLALCSDSTLASWGYGFFGQLGNSTVNDRSVPVAVNTAGVLSGRTVAAMTAGYYHSVVLCSDGAVAAWGYNADGELGDNITNNSTLPVAVNTAGVLSGKTVVAVAGGEGHSLALCADGTLAAWGRNLNGQLGNNSTANSPVAVAVSGSLLASGERYAAVIGGCYASHDFASIVAPVTPGVIASAVTGITLTSATLNGTVNPNGNASTAYFEYGLTPSYGTTASVTLSPNNGTAPQGVSASLTGLPSGTLYHYRLTGTNSAGTASTSDGTFTTISTNANLANLGLSASTLSPAFASATTSYSAIASGTSAINVTPIAADGTASIKVNGVTVASGSASGPVSVASGSATITTVVAAQDGTTAKTYTATVTKAPLTWTYNAATEIPITGGIFTTDGAATLAQLRSARWH